MSKLLKCDNCQREIQQAEYFDVYECWQADYTKAGHPAIKQGQKITCNDCS